MRGLCADCAHARLVRNDRGSEFLRCARAEHDPRFPRYPRLPVLDCAGYDPLTRAPDEPGDGSPAR